MTKKLEKALHAFTEKAIQEGYDEGIRDGKAEARAEIRAAILDATAERFIEISEVLKIIDGERGSR